MSGDLHKVGDELLEVCRHAYLQEYKMLMFLGSLSKDWQTLSLVQKSGGMGALQDACTEWREAMAALGVGHAMAEAAGLITDEVNWLAFQVQARKEAEAQFEHEKDQAQAEFDGAIQEPSQEEEDA